MDSALIICTSMFSLSVVAAAQMGLYYWRAMIATVAAQPISDQRCPAVKLAATAGSARDFRMLLSLREMAPALQGPSSHLWALRSYSFALEQVQRVMPATANWCRSEMSICSRYAAVLLDQHLQRNEMCAAEIYHAM